MHVRCARCMLVNKNQQVNSHTQNGTMQCYKMRFVFVLLIVNYVIADEHKCTNGNCTVELDDVNVQHNGSHTTPDQLDEIVTHDMEPVAMPTAMNMLVEDDDHHQHHLETTSILPAIFVTVPAPTDIPKGRAINFTLEEHHTENGIANNSSATSKKNSFRDLSDVSMDDEDEDMQNTPTMKLVESANHTMGICIKGGLTYSNGEKIEDGCETVCTCTNGNMECTDRCVGPYFRRGKKIDDPLCSEKPVEDPCCSILVCAADTETEPLEMCSYKNKTYHRGEKFHDGCAQVCMCEVAGKLSCKPRCRPVNKTSDKCVEVADTADPCCKKLLCDVTLDDHEHDKDQDIPKLKLISAKYVNSTAILLKFDSKLDEKNMLPDVELSSDQINWKTYRVMPGGYLLGMKSDVKYARLENTDDYVMVQNSDFGVKNDVKKDDGVKTCVYNGEAHKLGDEFYDNCTAFCKCLESGVKCLKIQCPTHFGLDIVDPQCLDWETVPRDFIPKAPNCCPKEMRCINNGSCLHEGVMYQNWQELPSNVTGCEKRCYCEHGKLDCHPACPPVPAVPPLTLPCPPHQAIVANVPDDDCCMAWMCAHPQEHSGTDDKTPKKTDKNRLDGFSNRTITKKPFLPTTPSPPTNANITHDDSTNFAGPLVIYENEKPVKSKNKTFVYDSPDLQNLHIDHDISLVGPKPGDKIKNTNNNEDPSYENVSPWAFGPVKGNAKPTLKDDVLIKPIPDSSKVPSSYAGPFNPDFKNPSGKPKKGNKTSTANTGNPNKQKPEQFISQLPHLPIPQQIPYDPQQTQYTNLQNPEEILQIINQHPELANYPSGAVFEIHNFPSDVSHKPINPEYLNPQIKYPQNPIRRPPPQNQSPLGSYLINQIDPGNTNNFSPNLPIDHLLKHVQEGQMPTGIPRPPITSFAQNTPFSQNPIFAPPGLQYSMLNNQPQLNQTAGFGGFPGRFPNSPGYQQSPDEIKVQQVEAVDGQTVRLTFTVSPLIVGLHGRVEVRYTNREDDNIASWELQVFAPPNDLITTQQLEFDLIGLQPNTEYKVKITVILRDLHNTPTSQVYSVRTLAQPTFPAVPKMIPIEPNLIVNDVNSTWANIVWRKFTDYELQFVDGVQLRFKEITGKVYAATPLIHRAVTSYLLENLKPNTEYEVGIFFIPFTGQNTELNSENMVHFTTTSEIDPYGFNVTLEIQLVKATTVEVAWSGVPYPEDKYVNIYRAIYQSDSGKGDSSTFKIAKRDSPKKTTILDLKPGTRYRLWLEVYLTSGKIKTSNVQDFITKPRAALALGASTQQGKLSSDEVPDHTNDYYGSLVVVAILAAIAILTTLILLMILLRRHSQNKAPISTPARVSQAAYDNPTYKVEIQQETMGL